MSSRRRYISESVQTPVTWPLQPALTKMDIFDHGREVRMKTQTMRKLAALLTGAALALSFPVASSVADAGGVPNSHSKPCKQKGNGTTKTDPTPGKGKKCGFHKS